MLVFMQALLQSGEIEESIPHFQHALRLLNTRLPSRRPSVLISIMFQAIRQWLHVKFPRRFTGRHRYIYNSFGVKYMCVPIYVGERIFLSVPTA